MDKKPVFKSSKLTFEISMNKWKIPDTLCYTDTNLTCLKLSSSKSTYSYLIFPSYMTKLITQSIQFKRQFSALLFLKPKKGSIVRKLIQSVLKPTDDGNSWSLCSSSIKPFNISTKSSNIPTTPLTRAPSQIYNFNSPFQKKVFLGKSFHNLLPEALRDPEIQPVTPIKSSIFFSDTVSNPKTPAPTSTETIIPLKSSTRVKSHYNPKPDLETESTEPPTDLNILKTPPRATQSQFRPSLVRSVNKSVSHRPLFQFPRPNHIVSTLPRTNPNLDNSKDSLRQNQSTDTIEEDTPTLQSPIEMKSKFDEFADLLAADDIVNTRDRDKTPKSPPAPITKTKTNTNQLNDLADMLAQTDVEGSPDLHPDPLHTRKVLFQANTSNSDTLDLDDQMSLGSMESLESLETLETRCNVKISSENEISPDGSINDNQIQLTNSSTSTESFSSAVTSSTISVSSTNSTPFKSRASYSVDLNKLNRPSTPAFGRGGMDSVYEVEIDQGNFDGQSRAAVKILPNCNEINGYREARFQRLLRPYTPTVYAAGFNSSSLEYWIVSQKCIPHPVSVISSMEPILKLSALKLVAYNSLQFLCSTKVHSIIFHDLKASNIVYSPYSSTFLICDLGSARYYNPDLPDKMKRIPGTPFYFAPESGFGTGLHTPAMDIWALGITLLRMGNCSHPTLDRLVSIATVSNSQITTFLNSPGFITPQFSYFGKDWDIFNSFLSTCLDRDYLSRPSPLDLLNSSIFSPENFDLENVQKAVAKEFLNFNQ